MSGKKTIKFNITAEIHRFSLKKNIKFLTKVIWKRHTNKAQTATVQHQNGFSTFNQKLTLQINLVYDQQKQLYEDKNTQILASIQYQGKVKSGGYAKYNIAQVINNNLKNKMQSIPLVQCPDPNAFIQITFDYSNNGQNFDDSMSVLNVSSQNLDMSRIDFNDDKLSSQIDRINNTVKKLNQLSVKVKSKENKTTQNVPKLKTTVELLEGEKLTLKKQLENLQKSSRLKEDQFNQQKAAFLKQISDLQKQVLKKDKQLKQKVSEDQKNKNKTQAKDKGKDYQKLYQDARAQILQLKSLNLRQSMGFEANFDVQNIATFNNSSQDDEPQKPKKVGQNLPEQKDNSNLKKINEQLQQNVAEMSFKLATLFNASFQYGGAKLLDHLQNAIGLIEKSY